MQFCSSLCRSGFLLGFCSADLLGCALRRRYCRVRLYLRSTAFRKLPVGHWMACLVRTVIRSNWPAKRALRSGVGKLNFATLRVCLQSPLAKSGVTVLGFSLFSLMNRKDAKEKVEDIISRADILYEDYMIDALYDYLNERLADNRTAEILWRLARVIYEKAKSVKVPDDQQQMYSTAMEYVKEALECGSNLSAVHKWYAILLNCCSENGGQEARLKAALKVREHLDRALELNPSDATSWHILGVWYYTFADLPWYKRKLAEFLYPQLPVTTYQQALECFEKAESICPEFYSRNLLMIGNVYLRLNQPDVAKGYFTKTLNMVVLTADDRKAFSEAEEQLKNLG